MVVGKATFEVFVIGMPSPTTIGVEANPFSAMYF
jgi:hypothetical protein